MLLQESTQTHSTCEHWRKYLELILVFESGSRLELVNSNLLNLNKRRREKSYMSAPTATPSASALQQRIFQQNLRLSPLFWNPGLDGLDLSRGNAGERALMLWPAEAGAYRIEILNRHADGRLALPNEGLRGL